MDDSTEYWIIVGIVWVFCATVSAGWQFAYAQDNWPNIAKQEHRQDQIWAWLLSLGGPVSVAVIYLTTEFAKFGWRLK